jgi:hypothetical protein
MTLSELTRLLEPLGLALLSISASKRLVAPTISQFSRPERARTRPIGAPNNGVRKDWPFCLTPVTVPVIVVRDHRADLPIAVCWLIYGIHEEQVESSERIRVVDEGLC